MKLVHAVQLPQHLCHKVEGLIDFEILVPHLSDIVSNLIGDFRERLRDWLSTCSIQILIM